MFSYVSRMSAREQKHVDLLLKELTSAPVVAAHRDPPPLSQINRRPLHEPFKFPSARAGAHPAPFFGPQSQTLASTSSSTNTFSSGTAPMPMAGAHQPMQWPESPVSTGFKFSTNSFFGTASMAGAHQPSIPLPSTPTRPANNDATPMAGAHQPIQWPETPVSTGFKFSTNSFFGTASMAGAHQPSIPLPSTPTRPANNQATPFAGAHQPMVAPPPQTVFAGFTVVKPSAFDLAGLCNNQWAVSAEPGAWHEEVARRRSARNSSFFPRTPEPGLWQRELERQRLERERPAREAEARRRKRESIAVQEPRRGQSAAARDLELQAQMIAAERRIMEKREAKRMRRARREAREFEELRHWYDEFVNEPMNMD
ncbi:hypothetical protein MIND_01326500 [Mycena indigotica]|uniref:Uncharacterized protein n=1 Tax=Mycena indigotica TaxID=2126181 RepID=A0A8H6VUS2_9AGAR|nr:uncharacterized protein MIND_01326500 [Mycena indigotica]KAF7290853.1 hypothetical protein MIND_01326500 [Mycena indigotica]